MIEERNVVDVQIEKIKGKSTLLTINGITKPVNQWAQENGLSTTIISRRIRNGWPEDKLFQSIKSSPRYSFNEHFFDVIDDENKAYWIGFIWCDGYMAIRNRNNRTSYEFKLSLKEEDSSHLIKFNNDISGNYEIKHYACNGFKGQGKSVEARILITNQHFGKTLVNNYGLIPERTNCSKLLKQIPEHLVKHFIRGIIDADGSFCQYDKFESNNYGKVYLVHKCTVDIGCNKDILKFIENHLIKNNIVNNYDRKIIKRHEEDNKDGEYRNLKFSGRIQALKLLHYIYDDATIFLNRKYEKYLNIISKLEGLDAI